MTVLFLAIKIDKRSAVKGFGVQSVVDLADSSSFVGLYQGQELTDSSPFAGLLPGPKPKASAVLYRQVSSQ